MTFTSAIFVQRIHNLPSLREDSSFEFLPTAQRTYFACHSSNLQNFQLISRHYLRFYAQSACYFSQQSLHAQIRPKFLYDHPHRRWSEILHWAILTHSVILLRSILLVTQPDKFYLNIYGPKIEPRRGATAFPHLLGIHDFVRLSLRLHALMSWPAELLDFLASPPEFVPLRHRRLPRRRGSSRSSKRLTEPLDPGRYPHPPSVPGDSHARDVL